MKKNRSNKFTQGIVITNDTNDKRFLFFELDNPSSKQLEDVKDVYRRYGLDFCYHRSGNGIHFISPTLLSVETWKEIMGKLKHINKKCPMTTLRWIPNKYPNEREVWFTSQHWCDPNNLRRNSLELSQLLNKTFKTDFEGTIQTELKFVRYPLP